MNVWDFDGDGGTGGSSIVRSEIQPSKRNTGGSFQVKKHAFFADTGDDDVTFSSEPTTSRRKQSGMRKELVLESDDCDDLDEESHPRPSTSKELGKQGTSSSSSNAKVDETGMPDIVRTVLRSKVSQPAAAPASTTSTSDKKRVSITDLSQDHELFMHYLVREFLKQHGVDDSMVNLFEKERPMQVLEHKQAAKTFEHITGHRSSLSKSSSSIQTEPDDKQSVRTLLEQLVVMWDEKVHKRKHDKPPSSSRRSSASRQSESTPESNTTVTTSSSCSKKKSSNKSSSSSSTKKKKPALNVITSAEELANVDDLIGEQINIEYNRLNHPGSTPKPQSADTEVACILGDPGSTPKARVSDLRALGFDEDELNTPVPAENVSSSAAAIFNCEDDLDGISDYARNKRIVKKHSKHVSLGESGATPRKEYIFFRETPPSFVTETVEAAVQVYEKLVQDPVFHQQAAPQERFVELQSSEVSKYTIGQEVQDLGAQRNVSGVVSKVFGSRQCGSSGPGTIVIDTCPEP
uniref:Uncharacterized protein n=1 Tax=Globisporangium ultimum (strain ATCC 200006 / CBS 805.95 / DAOM BR144) TaxID=431595 RepID=K3WGY0_GLOUD